MNTRIIILISALALFYIYMVIDLSNRYPDQSNPIIHITFGVILIGAAIAGAFVSKYDQKLKGFYRVIKILIASQAIIFATWMLGSVLTLPITGYAGFELLTEPFFGILFLVGTLLLAPIIAKKLK